MRRFLAIFKTRNLEFVRDRSSFGWNIAFPIVLIFGMWAIFTSGGRPMFKVGVMSTSAEITVEHAFLDTRHTQFIAYQDQAAAVELVAYHKLDLLMEFGDGEIRYWVNTTAPKGYVLEKMIAGVASEVLIREEVVGEQVRYVDWLIPGILGMNMMFSCLFGIGYVIVRYRKNGYLKRLYATPLTAFEYIAAQVASRLILVMSVTSVVFVATVWLLGVRMAGSYFDLFVVATVGALSLISMGLLVGARSASEELAGGLLNLFSWPMMLISGVWFSLEGSTETVRWAAQLFPLTHLLTAARAVMLDGDSLFMVWDSLLIMLAITAALMALSAWMFRWKVD